MDTVKEKLDDKAEEIKNTLEQWASENAILLPGQYLEFTLSIKNKDTVVRLAAENQYLDMHPLDFFSSENFKRCGITKYEKGRVSICINTIRFVYDKSKWEYTLIEHKTMREFLAANHSTSLILREQNVGRKTVSNIVEILTKCGLSINNDSNISCNM